MNHRDSGFSPVGAPRPWPVPGTPPVAPRPRTGRAGIWVGAGLLVLAVVVPLTLVLTVVVPAWDLDRRSVPADGAPHGLVLPAHADYALYSSNSPEWGAFDPACRATDGAGGAIDLRSQSGTTTVAGWKVLRRFDTGSGMLVLTCDSPDGTLQHVEVGRAPRIGPMIGGVFGAIGLAGLFGLAGLVCIVVTVVRRSRR
ncbi:MULTISPECIES: hypothetical protein [Tsukamurella]|uniref:Uncharacterized protein n=2 Tax=Tsukamurella TaxID=2060 RepID=A0A5C5S5A0_9ACTN|nr:MULTISPECIES: hypothetical protein [Tsukamurella]NMD56916.1 hypothetical protein [Tsukamurella columbiensis]TWS29818.1 hypothetical protein FK530_04590 [Tsukamurella conjunctivitidis]